MTDQHYDITHIPGSPEVSFTQSGGGLCMIRIPKIVIWNPQEDITTYELALCVPFLNAQWGFLSYPEDHIPKGCERHFTITDRVKS